MPPKESDQRDSKGTPSTEVTDDNGKSLADRLNEFQKATQQKGATDKGMEERLAAAEQKLSAYQQAEASREYRKEMDNFMVPTVRGELDVHPKLVEQWLNEQADRDPRLTEVWEKRGEDRAKFEETVAGLQEKFAAYAEKENLAGTTGTRESKDPKAKLQSAVRSARQSSSAPGDFSSVNVAALSDTEFALHKAEVFRLQSAGHFN